MNLCGPKGSFASRFRPFPAAALAGLAVGGVAAELVCGGGGGGVSGGCSKASDEMVRPQRLPGIPNFEGHPCSRTSSRPSCLRPSRASGPLPAPHAHARGSTFSLPDAGTRGLTVGPGPGPPCGCAPAGCWVRGVRWAEGALFADRCGEEGGVGCPFFQMHSRAVGTMAGGTCVRPLTETDRFVALLFVACGATGEGSDLLCLLSRPRSFLFFIFF